jgi:RNA polymerase sigma-70 factor (sigma-E family)
VRPVVTFASEWVSTANLPTRSASRILAHLGRCSGIELCERRKLLGVAGPGRRSFGRRLPDTGSYSDARLERIVATEPSPEVPLVIFDAAAFAEVFHDHYGGLVRLAILLCNNPGQAEDAVAEAYARVWPQFREGAVDDVLPYLRRAVVNQVHGRFRRRLLELREESRQAVDWREGVSPERNVDDRQQLSAAIRALPAKQLDVVVLRFYEDLTEEETARALGIKLGTVKSRCARALQRLRHEVGRVE